MRFIRLPQLQNVNPNSRVSLRLPLGVVYEKIYLQLGGNILNSLITNIVLRLNNKEVQRWNTYADMAAFNGYKGNTVTTQFLTFDFTERLAREEIGMKLGTIAACAEAGVQDFTLEFDVGTYTVTGASVITAWADVETPSANTIIQRVQYYQKVIAGAAEEQLYIPFGASGQQVKRIIIKHANLASVRVRRDGVDIYDNVPVGLANLREQDFGRVPQAGYQVVDFMPDTLQSNALNTAQVLGPAGPALVQNLDVRLVTSAADTLTVYVESYALNNML